MVVFPIQDGRVSSVAKTAASIPAVTTVQDTKVKISAPQVKETWTPAPSNANYAFQVKEAGMNNFLILKDLRTGKTVELIKVQPTGQTLEKLSNFCDVSPDGTTVIFGTTTPTSGTIYVVELGTHPTTGEIKTTNRLTFTGILQGISFYKVNGNPFARISMKQSSAGKAKMFLINLTSFIGA